MVTSIAFSPDGRSFVSSSIDYAVLVWDARSGEQIARLVDKDEEILFDAVNSVAFSPDGLCIASGSSDAKVQIFDAKSGILIKTFEGHTDEVDSVTFSPDGKRIASGSRDNTVRVWNTDNGEEIARMKGHTSRVNSVAFSPDGSRIVSGSGKIKITLRPHDTIDNTVRIWNAENGVQIRLFEGHADAVNSVVFSPDGKSIASCSSYSTALVWNAADGKITTSFEERTGVFKTVSFSSDGKHIIVSGSSSREVIRIWDTKNAKQTTIFKGYTTSLITCVAFSPDGQHILCGTYSGTLHIWDTERRIQSGQLRNDITGSHSKVEFSQDSQHIICTLGDQTVHVWDAVSGICLQVIEGTKISKKNVTEQVNSPYRLTTVSGWGIVGRMETKIESTLSGMSTAWFPIPFRFSYSTSNFSSRKWAMADESHLYILELVGDLAIQEK